VKFKQARLDAGLLQTDVVPELKKVDSRADVGMLSRYENGVCLPTPPQFRVLCGLYKREPREIVTPEEVDFGVKKDRPKKDSHKADTYKLFARIPRQSVGDLKAFKEKLRVCGYQNITAWLCHCIKRLEVEYAARQKGKDRPDAATSKAVNS